MIRRVVQLLMLAALIGGVCVADRSAMADPTTPPPTPDSICVKSQVAYTRACRLNTPTTNCKAVEAKDRDGKTIVECYLNFAEPQIFEEKFGCKDVAPNPVLPAAAGSMCVDHYITVDGKSVPNEKNCSAQVECYITSETIGGMTRVICQQKNLKIHPQIAKTTKPCTLAPVPPPPAP